MKTKDIKHKLKSLLFISWDTASLLKAVKAVVEKQEINGQNHGSAGIVH